MGSAISILNPAVREILKKLRCNEDSTRTSSKEEKMRDDLRAERSIASHRIQTKNETTTYTSPLEEKENGNNEKKRKFFFWGGGNTWCTKLPIHRHQSTSKPWKQHHATRKYTFQGGIYLKFNFKQNNITTSMNSILHTIAACACSINLVTTNCFTCTTQNTLTRRVHTHTQLQPSTDQLFSHMYESNDGKSNPPDSIVSACFVGPSESGVHSQALSYI